MKSIIVFISLLALVNNPVSSQFNFANDVSFRPFLKSTVREIDKKFHLETGADFELRLWVINSVTEPNDLFVLYYKNETWNGRLFEVKYSPFAISERQIKNNNFDTLWNGLMKNNVLTIPQNRELKDSSGKEAAFAISDGVLYCFELITKTNKRSYFYTCPQLYLEKYPYIKEFGWVVNILRFIFKYCELEDEIGFSGSKASLVINS